MYELIGNELLKVERIETPVQTATVRTGLYSVHGYDRDDPIIFEAIPERPDGENWQLYLEDGNLVWKEIDE